MACKWLHDTSSRCFVSPLNVIAAAPHSTSGCVHCSIASTQLRSNGPSNAEGAVCIMLMNEDPTTLN
jgi:hypothetical protein